jgi:hypothetical protein
MFYQIQFLLSTKNYFQRSKFKFFSFSSIKFCQINRSFQLFKSIINFLQFTLFDFYSKTFLHWLKNFFYQKKIFSFFYSNFKLVFSSFHFFFSHFYNPFLFSSKIFILLQKNKNKFITKIFSLLLIFITFSIYQIIFLHLSITFKLLFSFTILLTTLFFQLTYFLAFFLQHLFIFSSFSFSLFHKDTHSSRPLQQSNHRSRNWIFE